jgi:hypothetical protein
VEKAKAIWPPTFSGVGIKIKSQEFVFNILEFGLLRYTGTCFNLAVAFLIFFIDYTTICSVLRMFDNIAT